VFCLYLYVCVPAFVQLMDNFLCWWKNLTWSGWYLSLHLLLYWDFLLTYQYLFYRTSRSEFIVSVNKYLEARSHKLSVGMRFKMRFEGDEVPERRCTSWLIEKLYFDFSALCNLINWPLPLNTGSVERLWVLEITNRQSGLILSGDH